MYVLSPNNAADLPGIAPDLVETNSFKEVRQAIYNSGSAGKTARKILITAEFAKKTTIHDSG